MPISTMALSSRKHAFALSLALHIAGALILLYSPPVLKLQATLRSSQTTPALQFRIEKPQPKPKIQEQKEEPPKIKQATKKTITTKKVERTNTPKEITQQQTVIPVVKDIKLKGNRVPPMYPKRALQLRQEGTVIIHALVSEKGETEKIRIFKSSGHPLLDKEALNTVQKWHFVSTMQAGKNIKSWIEIPVEFVIK